MEIFEIWTWFHRTVNADVFPDKAFSARMAFITFSAVSLITNNFSIWTLQGNHYLFLSMCCRCILPLFQERRRREGGFLVLSSYSKRQGFIIKSCPATDIVVGYRILLSLAWFLKKQCLGIWACAHLWYPFFFVSVFFPLWFLNLFGKGNFIWHIHLKLP